MRGAGASERCALHLRRRRHGEARHAAFKLRHASFKGDGLRSELHGADWAQVRDLAYGGHGA